MGPARARRDQLPGDPCQHQYDEGSATSKVDGTDAIDDPTHLRPSPAHAHSFADDSCHDDHRNGHDNIRIRHDNWCTTDVDGHHANVIDTDAGRQTAFVRVVRHRGAPAVLAVALIATSVGTSLAASSSRSPARSPPHAATVVGLASETHASPVRVPHHRASSQTSPATVPAPPSAVSTTMLEGMVGDPGPDGQYVWTTISGAVSGLAGRVLLWLPRSYSLPGSSTQHYPVIEVFHGVPGRPQDYVGLNPGHLMAVEASTRHVKEAILVIPDYTPHDLDTECVNGGPGRPAMEDWLTRDIPTWVQHTLRADPQPAAWSTMGFSAGGWCAAMATMLHPDVYGSAIALGGYFRPDFGRSYRPFARGSAAWDRYDLVKLAATSPPAVSLWLQTAPQDSVSYPTSLRLIAAARPPLSVTSDVLAHGGHLMSIWLGLMPATFQWLGSTSPGFKP